MPIKSPKGWFPGILVCAVVLRTCAGCASASTKSAGGGGGAVTISPQAASVQVPGGTQQFTATVSSNLQGQNISWSLTGTGCNGAGCGTLSANSTSPGASVIYNAPTSAPRPATVTLAATSAANNSATSQASITLTATAGTGISVSVSPKRGGLVVSQSLPVTAAVQNDSKNAGVIWSVTGPSCSGSSCGTFTQVTGTSATYVAASTPGVYYITATSVADATKTGTSYVGVTDLSGMLTHHNDLSRDGANTHEFALTASNVTTATFGKLFSCPTDGAIYAQPLWVPQVSIAGTSHNVVVVATQHDGLYAFDADASPCATLWHVNLLDSNHGGTAGEIPVPSSGVNALVGEGAGDIAPEVGVTGTPVIDSGSNTVYVVSKSVSGSTFFQRLHAIDLTTGNERVTPKSIDASISVPGNAPDSIGGQVSFNPGPENQRPALALYNGVVYVSWASHEDADPFHGWLVGFNASNLGVATIFNVTPNAVATISYARGGIWMSGGGPSVDANGFLYCITGNGAFNANAGGSDYSDSILKFSTAGGLSVKDYFTPFDQATLDANDEDFGGGAATILIDQPNAPVPHLIVGGGKNGALFVMNRDNLGGYTSSTNHVVQGITVGQPIFATPVFWQGNLYVAPAVSPLMEFVFSASTGQFGGTAYSVSAVNYGKVGSTPSLSSNGAGNGIVWVLDNTNYCTPQAPACGPTVLHAYDATNLATELWNSSQSGGRDQAAFAVKFTVPTIANGKVYVPTRGNNTGGSASSTSIPGELDVYGLLPN